MTDNTVQFKTREQLTHAEHAVQFRAWLMELADAIEAGHVQAALVTYELQTPGQEHPTIERLRYAPRGTDNLMLLGLATHQLYYIHQDMENSNA